jgi:methylase of polypeptide subunit release factors
MDRQPIFTSARTELRRLSDALQARAYRFIAVTPATHRSVNARPENSWARSLADIFGWSRPFAAGVLDPELFELARAAGVLERLDSARDDGWRSLVRAATLDDLLFLHSAFPTDAPDAVFFGPDTYRFTDAIARHLAERRPSVRRAVDLGTGAGAGGIVLARAFPEADIFLTDINATALAAAEINAAAAGVSHVDCRRGDLFAGLDGDFDLIVANPPYLVDAAARLYRHGGGALGAELSLRIVAESGARLAPAGSLVLYTGSAIVAGTDRFRETAAALLTDPDLRWRYREIDPDVFGEELGSGAYARADRIAAVALIVQRAPWT